jgi:uncharacterized protein
VILAAAIGLALGLLLGAVGGGGAILTVPVLVYLLGEPPHTAAAGALAVVAAGAATGAVGHARGGRVCWALALAFSAAAVPGGLAGSQLSSAVSGRALMAGFALVMLAAAGATWWRSGRVAEGAAEACPAGPLAAVAGAGLAVGLLTGFFGVGGGFVVVPVLTLALGVGIRRAAATSLAIVGLVSLAGLAGHLAAGMRPDWAVVLPLAAALAAGAWAGAGVMARLSQRLLATGFAGLVAVVAVGMLAAAAAG